MWKAYVKEMVQFVALESRLRENYAKEKTKSVVLET